jgi:hypothetical protein
MIVIVGGLARETGKTTIAVNLAVNRAQRKESVAILDCEPDNAAMDWLKMRHRFGFEIGSIYPDTYQIDVFPGSDDITGALNSLSQKYDHVLVDVSSRNMKAMLSAMQVADKFYTPVHLDEIHGRMRVSDLAKMITENKTVNPKMGAYLFANRSSFPGNAPNKEIAQTVSHVTYISPYICLQSDWPVMEHDIAKKSSCLGLGLNEIPVIGDEAEICDAQDAWDELKVLANHVFGDAPFMYPKGHTMHHSRFQEDGESVTV